MTVSAISEVKNKREPIEVNTFRFRHVHLLLPVAGAMPEHASVMCLSATLTCLHVCTSALKRNFLSLQSSPRSRTVWI